LANHSLCPKCASPDSFEVANVRLMRSDQVIMIIRCSMCGVVVGTMDQVNLGKTLENLTDILAELVWGIDTEGKEKVLQ
jgi:hypothetical protein